MVQQTVVTVVCDLPHDSEVEGAETLAFAFDGGSYEIDACGDHAKDLREAFGTYTEHGRRLTASRAPRRHRTPEGRGRSGDIRAWAKDQGIPVSDRGRIPAGVVAQWEASR